jgi:hypothetical protein
MFDLLFNVGNSAPSLISLLFPQVNRVVESTLRQIPPQIRQLEARKAIQMCLGRWGMVRWV